MLIVIIAQRMQFVKQHNDNIAENKEWRNLQLKAMDLAINDEVTRAYHIARRQYEAKLLQIKKE